MQQQPPLAAIIAALAIALPLIGGLGYLIITTLLDVLASPKTLLVQLASRSITSHKVKSLIVGGLLSFGTVLLVVGITFLINTRRQMEQTITGGLVGHLQIYSSEAKDQLAFFGFASSGSQDLSVLNDFATIKKDIEALPNVESVIPMGRDVASAVGGNEFDDRLGELRKAIAAKDEVKTKQLVSRIRHMIELLKADQTNRAEITRSDDETKEHMERIEKALSPEFWANFDANPEPVLEYLDTKIAQLQADDGLFFLPYIGTDVDSFAKHFDRFGIDTDNGSQMIPAGRRGFLLSRQFYEEQAKNQVAHELDEIKRIMRDDKTTIADSVDIRERIKKNIKQYRRITYQLSAEDAAALSAELKTLMPTATGELADQLKAFLDVNDGNFVERYKFFYDHVAPRIRLYKVRIGDTLTLRAFTKSGYTRALNLQVYGTFHFRGIDGSPVASRYNFMDLMSFRDLYGLMTPERKKELEAIKASIGTKDVNRESAEDELFGSGATGGTEERQTTQFGDPTQEETLGSRASARENNTKPFTQDDIDNGVVLNASIRLKDGSAGALSKTMADINKLNKDKNLHIQVIDWTTASGIVGQLVAVLTAILLVIIGVIFLVTLVIINNSMVMATMDRIIEIGMMRAIGAQRRFVRAMYMLETLVLTVVSVSIGCAVGTALVLIASKTGLRAPADLLVIMFGGRWLYPTVEPAAFAISLIVIGVVSLAATFYPALIATRIAPIVAMQRRE